MKWLKLQLHGRPLVGFLVATVVFYLATVGAVPAIGRHMEDGALQGLRDSSLVGTGLAVYAWPGGFMAKVPLVGWFLERSAEFWCEVTNAPETT